MNLIETIQDNDTFNIYILELFICYSMLMLAKACYNQTVQLLGQSVYSALSFAMFTRTVFLCVSMHVCACECSGA